MVLLRIFFTAVIVIALQDSSDILSAGETAYLDLSEAFVPSGWMGDGEYGRKYVTLDTHSIDTSHSATESIRVEYHPGPQKWAGVYWQSSPNNWGKEPGLDLTGATKVSFWAKGATGKEVVEFLAGGINSPGVKNSDSFSASTGRITLTNEWKQYSINLTGLDLSNVIGGFAWVCASSFNQGSAVFYLDDIRYEWLPGVKGGELSIQITKPTGGEMVGDKVVITGIVSDPKAKVFVVIHPPDVAGYWIQPPVSIKNDGSWSVNAYVGNQLKMYHGLPFEIRAVANPTSILREGIMTEDWPKANAMSKIITVIRKDN